MTLDARVTERYSANFLRALTNPDKPEATGVDSARLGFAATDVLGDFLSTIGVAYDETLTEHVSVAVEGVIAKLAMRNGIAGSGDLHDEYISRLAKLSGRLLPRTSSVQTPTAEDASDKPIFDDDFFLPFIATRKASVLLGDDD